MSIEQNHRGGVTKFNGDSSPEPFTILIGEEEADSEKNPQPLIAANNALNDLKPQSPGQDNLITAKKSLVPQQGELSKKGFIGAANEALKINNSKTIQKIATAKNSNEMSQVVSSAGLKKSTPPQQNKKVYDSSSAKPVGFNSAESKNLNGKNGIKIGSHDLKNVKGGKDQVYVIEEDDENDKKPKTLKLPKVRPENGNHQRKSNGKIEVIALDDEDEAPSKKSSKATSKNGLENPAQNQIKDDLKNLFAPKPDGTKLNPITAETADLLNRKPEEFKFLGVFPPRLGDTLPANPFNKALTDAISSEITNRVLGGHAPNPLNFFHNLQMASMLSNPALSKPPFQPLGSSGTMPSWPTNYPNYPMNYLSLMQNMPPYPPTNPNFLLLNPLFQRKFNMQNLFPQHPESATNHEANLPGSFQKMASSSSVDIEREKSHISNKMQEEKSRDDHKSVSNAIQSVDIISDKSKSGELDKESKKKNKNKIIIPKLSAPVSQSQAQLPVRKPPIFEIKYNKKRASKQLPLSSEQTRTETSLTDFQKDTDNSSSNHRLEEGDALEKNLERKEFKNFRRTQRSNFVPSTLSSYLSEKTLKPRRRNKLQVMSEERDKLIEEFKVLETLKNDEDADGPGIPEEEEFYELDVSPLGSEYSFKTKERLKAHKLNINKAKIGKNHQAVVPNFLLSIPERTRRFKKIWNPDELDANQAEEFIGKVGDILSIDWCRQDFALRLLKQNSMNSDSTLDILNTNKDFFSNLFKSKWSL